MSLEELKPDALDEGAATWQQRKSAQTRLALLEAAVTCLHDHGYSSTTTHLISQTAEISRGAMLHHYATKQDLIASVIDYVFYKRMEQFKSRIEALTEQQRVGEHAGIQVYWESLLTREFSVYLELEMASRTDVDLRAVFLPKARLYDRVERETALSAFPEWAGRPELFELAMDYCIAGMTGLLLNRDVWDDRARRIRLRGFISNTLLLLRNGRLDTQGQIVPKNKAKPSGASRPAGRPRSGGR